MASAGPAYADSECPIDLGFLEPCEPWLLQSRFFRSKFGGRPSWLDLENLPAMEEMRCPDCKDPMTFLCQIYAPIDTQASAFHRTLFIFLCKSAKCLKFKVLRCQLGRDNRFYPHEAPMEHPEWKPEIRADTFVRLCRACGCGVDGVGGKCGGCKRVDYCHRKCQVTDWKRRHKHECKRDDFDPKKMPNESSAPGGLLFKEFEIVMAGDDGSEVTDDNDSDEEEEGDDAEASELENFRQLEAEGKTGQLTAEDLAQFDVKNNQDKALRKFRKVVASAPDQVIRYAKRPLWVSDTNTPEEVPPCPLCSAPRTFEFQVMPQALNHLALDKDLSQESLDWGTLAVYTCKESCNEPDSPAYKDEFIWRQPMS